ncbi:MAG: ABC transporter substrate-binding protein [Syntrophorhabdaceae bacterium]|nr:ABC transporter substrate-binding protein [Syntrophorhabdaceae bacterium]
MKRTIFIICVLMLVLAFSGSLFAKETVRIGLIVPLTGDVKTFGESYKNAFSLALEEYVKKGKYTIDPVIADDKNDPTEGTNAALKLMTQDKVTAVIGPMTSKVAIPVSELATKQKVPLVTGTATNPKVTISDGKRKPYVFRACFIDPFQGTVAAGFALKNLKAGTAAILYDVGNDYSKGLADYFQATFKKGKGAVVAYESYQKDDVDFSALITKIQIKKPDVIYIPDYYNKVALIAKQIREKGLRSAMLGGDGWDSPDLVKNAGDAIMGSYFTNHYSPDRKDPVAEVFIKRYKERYNAVPDTFAALGYDATMILLKALDGAKKPSQDDIMKQLTALKNFKGVTGNIGFDKNGDAVKSVVILKVEKEGFKYVTTINP